MSTSVVLTFEQWKQIVDIMRDLRSVDSQEVNDAIDRFDKVMGLKGERSIHNMP